MTAGGDAEIDDQEPEEELAARRALLGLDLHAQHGSCAMCASTRVLGLLEPQAFRLAHRLDGFDEPAFGEQRGGLERQWLEPRARLS